MSDSTELFARIVREVMAELDAPRGREACERAPSPAHRVETPRDEPLLHRLISTTPSVIAPGRTGTRLLTDRYLRIREGHADAKDAVHSEVPEGWAEAQGLLPLQTRCRDRQEFLLFPNHGRRLCDESRARLEREGSRGAAVQLIVGDGLSSLAIRKNGLETLAAVQAALGSRNLAAGRPLFVRFARIGVADEIGVLLGARATAILVGERPGLGTGDSLSIYIAVAPRLDQDNAEKNCISNVRPIGIRPAEAGALAAETIARGIAQGRGGVALGVGYERR